MILFTKLPLNSIYVIFFLFLSHSKIFTYHYSMVCEVLIWGLQQVQNEFEELRL